MGKNSAEYMRAYRLRKKAARMIDLTTIPGRIDASFQIVRADSRIAELEEEVRHLKAELAKQSAEPAMNPHKTSQRAIDRAKEFLLLSAEPGDLAYTRKAQQAQRDRILARVNRGG